MARRLISAVLVIVTVLLYPVRALQAQLNIDFRAIQSIESGGNPAAFNQRTRCYGLYQISEICLQDYNQMNGTSYRPADLFDPGLNSAVAGWYFNRISSMLDHFGIAENLTTVIASYNWGIGNVIRWYRQGADFSDLPSETRGYIRTYISLTGR